MVDISEVFAKCRSLRRRLHERPEVGFEEFETAKTLKASLVDIGVETSWMTDYAAPGFVADIPGSGAPTTAAGVKTVALRAELDGLPLQEANLFLPYRSKNKGKAHMCGHDGHMASLVAAATLIMARRDRLPSSCRVRLLFQPAEEGPGGAKPMAEAGCLAGVDEIFAFHQDSGVPAGTLRVKKGSSGPSFMHNARFTITIIGEGGHGASPSRTKDPVPAMASLILTLQTIVSRSLDSMSDSLVISVTKMRTSTEGFNVIPEWAECGGTIRDVAPSTFEMVRSRITAIAEGCAAAAGCSAKVEIVDMYPALFNHDAQADAVARVARALLGNAAVEDNPITNMASEDFGYFLGSDPSGQVVGVPGAMFQLGNRDELRIGLATFDGMADGLDGGACWNGCAAHNPGFDFNDRLLPVAATMWYLLLASVPLLLLNPLPLATCFLLLATCNM